MIGKLKGVIVFSTDKYVVCDVSGVGYKVLGVSLKEGSEVELWIHTHVREDQITLYGFLDLEGLAMFENLISVSKIGPKTALGVLAIASPGQIKEAVVMEDESMLIKASGIGKKTAKRVILELRGKFEKEDFSLSLKGKEFQKGAEVLEALVAMGYSREQALEALKFSKETGIKEKIAECLRILGKKKYV
jgi:Holliday junction DNA helicase RuvA